MIGNISLENVRQCKHCKEIVIGNHEERMAHRAACKQRGAKQLLSQKDNGPSATAAAAAPASKPSADEKSMEHRKRMEAIAKSVCSICGKKRRPNTDDKSNKEHEECDNKKSLMMNMARAHTSLQRRGHHGDGDCSNSDDDGGGGQHRPLLLKDRMAMTPDLRYVDHKLERLIKKILPAIKPMNSEWVNCRFCQKRIVSNMLKKHIASACIVGSIISKIDWLERVAIQLDGGRHTCADDDDDEGVEPLSSQFKYLPPQARLVEELRLVASIINVVCPIADLMTNDNDPRSLLDHVPEIKARADAWMAKLGNNAPKSANVKDEKKLFQQPPQHLKEIVHAPPLETGVGVGTTSGNKTSSSSSSGPSRKDLLPITKTSDYRGYQLVPVDPSVAKKGATSYKTECRFDEQTLALANAVVAGDITFEEALSQSYVNIPAASRPPPPVEGLLNKWLQTGAPKAAKRAEGRQGA